MGILGFTFIVFYPVRCGVELKERNDRVVMQLEGRRLTLIDESQVKILQVRAFLSVLNGCVGDNTMPRKLDYNCSDS